jgi:hypothetical protein
MEISEGKASSFAFFQHYTDLGFEFFLVTKKLNEVEGKEEYRIEI